MTTTALSIALILGAMAGLNGAGAQSAVDYDADDDVGLVGDRSGMRYT